MSSDETARRGSGSHGRTHDLRVERGGRGGASRPAEAGTTDEGGESEAPKGSGDEEQRAREAVYRLLATRARSRSELMQTLLRKGIDEDVANRMLGQFDAAGLIDDAGFAESWVRQRHEHQGLGRKALGAELRRKGVDEEAVADALANVDDEAEIARARDLVRRKLRTMTVTDPTTRKRRLVSMLARKGYGQGMAFRVVREELDPSGMEDDSGMGSV